MQESLEGEKDLKLQEVNNNGGERLEREEEEEVADFGEEDSLLYPFPKCYRCFRDRAVLLLRAVVPLLRLTKLNPKQHET